MKKSFKFDCQECGNYGKIVYENNDALLETEVTTCPFCGSDISDDTDQTEEDYD